MTSDSRAKQVGAASLSRAAIATLIWLYKLYTLTVMLVRGRPLVYDYRVPYPPRPIDLGYLSTELIGSLGRDAAIEIKGSLTAESALRG